MKKAKNTGLRFATLAAAVTVMLSAGALSTAAEQTPVSTFIQTMILNGARNVTDGDPLNYAGWVGMKVTIGDQPLTVTALGRICTGDVEIHNMIIIDGETEAVVIDNIKAIGGEIGKMTYTDLPEPVVLEAGKTYVFATDVMTWQDKWYDATTVTTSKAATLNQVVVMGLNGWEYYDAPSVVWGPVDFKYEALPGESTTTSTTPHPTTQPSSSIHTTAGSSPDSSEPTQASTDTPALEWILPTGIAAVAVAAAVVVTIVLIRRKKGDGE